MISTRMIPETELNRKLLAAILALMSCRLLVIVSVLLTFLVCTFFVFVLIIDALGELAYHISQVWNASTPIERLLIFLIAWAIVYKLTPVVCLVIKKGYTL